MSVFARVFLFTGIPYGTFIGLFFYCRFPGENWSTLTCSSLGGGFIFGFILAVASWLFSRRGLLSRHFVVFAVMLGIVGLIASVLVFGQVNRLPHGGWTQLPSAPDTPTEFVGHSPFTFWGGAIYVRTKSGDIYSFDCPMESPCLWEKEALAADLDLDSEEGDLSLNAPRPPGRVIDSLDVLHVGVDYRDETQYVLLDDGSIWVWYRMYAAIELTSVCVQWSLGGLVLGVVGAFVVRSKQRSLGIEGA